MERPQPFMCPVCQISWASGKDLAQHMQDKHEPKWTAFDLELLKAFRIKVD